MIVLLMITVASSAVLFLALLPYGLFAALAGASLGASLLTAACAVVIVVWSTKRPLGKDPKRSLSSEPKSGVKLGRVENR